MTSAARKTACSGACARVWVFSRFRSFLECLHSPEKAFTRDLSGPSYLVPLGILGAASALLAYLQIPLQLDWARHHLVTRGAAQEEIVWSLQLIERSSLMGILLAPALLMFKWLAFSLLLWLTGLLFWDSAAYSRVFTVVSFSASPILLRDAFILCIAEIRRSSVPIPPGSVAIGVNLLFPSLPLPWSALAGNINLFEAWSAGLVLVGLAQIHGIGWKSALAVFLPNWLFVALLKFGMVSLGLAFQSRLS